MRRFVLALAASLLIGGSGSDARERTIPAEIASRYASDGPTLQGFGPEPVAKPSLRVGLPAVLDRTNVGRCGLRIGWRSVVVAVPISRGTEKSDDC